MAMSSFRDSISSLPDEIFGKILSLLPTKVAASTSILSKRWRNLLGLVDTLCFDDSMVVYPNEEESTSGSHRFSDFVERTFALLSNSRIKKVSLCHVPRCGRNHIYQRWISTAMELCLLELYLHASPYNTFVDIERELFTSNTLVKLTLSGAYSIESAHVFLPALKSLSLLSVYGLDYFNYCRILDGCPVLEELFIRDADHIYPPSCGATVESKSIKRLVVFVDLPDSKEDHDVAYIGAPSLEYLDYSSYVSENYQFLDLNLLVEARLSLMLWQSTYDYDDDDYDGDDDDDDTYDDDDDDVDGDDNDGCYFDGDSYYDNYDDKPKEAIFGDVTNLVAGISHITTLHLSRDSLEAFYFCCETMPVFNNLLNLSIESSKENGWQVMPLLLKSCPNLHSLVIKGLLHRVTNRCGDACACTPEKHKSRKIKKRKIVKEEEKKLCCLWTCQVKVLEILEYGGSLQELKQMRHFLGNLECLETVKVSVDTDNNDCKFLQANLLALPRVSSKCNNIQFV